MRFRLLAMLTGLMAVTACSEQPEREVSAVVVSIAPHANPKYDANELVVTARSPQGAMGSKPVLAALLNCKVGDIIPAKARGVALEFDGRACER
jgi:hypothetical protein